MPDPAQQDKPQRAEGAERPVLAASATIDLEWPALGDLLTWRVSYVLEIPVDFEVIRPVQPEPSNV